MFKKISFLSIIFIIISFNNFSFAQFGLRINWNFTTTAKIYLHPNSSDIFLRNSYFPIEDIYNYSAEFTYEVIPDLLIGLNGEYIKKTANGRNLTIIKNQFTETVEVEEGFELIPVELSLYYRLPFSTEKFKFYIGGGGGIYFGNHIRNFVDASVSSYEHKFAYGIQVSIFMEYFVKDFLALSGGMKFRDPEFTVKNKYNKREVNYNGDLVTIPQENFESKINIDGTLFHLGFTFYLPK
ncbi:MAG: hypothetical protein STSR0008_09540 [Ignavibacterium sp.]